MATIVDQETDALFWGTGYRPGHKLDPSDPQDAKMIPVWRDIHAKVQRQFDAGTLVTTFDHPVVAQNLVDAHAADQHAAASLDAAAKAPDQAAAQQHVAEAAAALKASAQKTAEAAKHQPRAISSQLVKEAAQQVAQQVPPPQAPGHQHVAHAQALAAHKPTPIGILDRETDARFAAQSGFAAGQKLDPSNPTDAALIPLWKDIFAKVKAEDAAGKLVLTYNNPIVAQNLADAHVADKVAAASLDAAASTPDPAAQQQHLATAQTASQISAQKTHEAATIQPPTVSPPIARQAAQAVAAAPPPPASAPAREHIAHAQAQAVGQRAAKVHHHHDRHGRRGRHGHGLPVKSTVHPDKIQDYRTHAAQVAHASGSQFVLVIQHPDGTPDQQTFGSRAELDAAYAKISDAHDQYAYVAAFDLTADPNAPVHDSVGVPAAEHVEIPAAGSADAGAPGGADAGATGGAGTADSGGGGTYADLAPKEGLSTGQKIFAAIATIGAVGAVAYMATRKRKPVPRVRAPKVFVASPASPARALKGSVA